MNQNQTSNSGPGAAIVLGIVLMALSFMVLWHMKHDQIVISLLKMQYYMLLPFAYLSGLAAQYLPIESSARNLAVGIVNLANHARDVKLGDLHAVANRVAYYYIAPFVIIPLWLAYKARHHPVLSAHQNHDDNKLLRLIVRRFPEMACVSNLDLTNSDIKGWEQSVDPKEFVDRYKLVKNGELRIDRTLDVLTKQLGPKITTLDKLKKHEKALFVVFCVRIFGLKDGAEAREKTDAARKILYAMNESFIDKDAVAMKFIPDYSPALVHFEKYAKRKEIHEILKRHPYVKTFLVELLYMSWKGGRLPTTQFHWLKPVDRGLFYVLNTAGRRKVSFSESLAATAQHAAEKVAFVNGLRLNEPYFAAAIDGLKEEMMKIGVIPRNDYPD